MVLVKHFFFLAENGKLGVAAGVVIDSKRQKQSTENKLQSENLLLQHISLLDTQSVRPTRRT